MDSTKKLNTWLVKCWMMQQKINLKRYCKVKKSTIIRKRLDLKEKKLKNDETTKKKIAKII